MPADAYLIAGLDALARSYRDAENAWAGFVNGHRAAGMLSAFFLAQEGLVAGDAVPLITRALDREWMGTALFQPLPDEPAAPGELERFLAAAWSCVGTTSADPHAVIFPSFALKALRFRPQAITRSRIDAFCRMAELYAAAQAMTVQPWKAADGSALAKVPDGQAAPIPPSARFHPESFSSGVLEVFCDLGAAHVNGHVWTYGCAVMELYELGYTDLARKAEAGFRHFVRVQQGIDVRDPTKAPLVPRITRPERADFWDAHPAGFLEESWAHAVKYPYAYLQFLRRSADDGLKGRSADLAYLVLDLYLSRPQVSASPA